MKKSSIVLMLSLSFMVSALGLRAGNELPKSGTGLVAGDENPCPKADATHHYIKVPLVYAHRELGTFQLYYETNKDFDSAKKTLFILNDGQQQRSAVGAPDELKKKYGLDMNIVRMEHRGMPCSRVEYVFTKNGVDWRKAYAVFGSENVIQDIDRIRVDLLGKKGKIAVLGGSGAGLLACQYLARYSRNVDRACVQVSSDNTESANRRQRENFFRLLDSEGMMQAYLDILNKHPVPEIEFLWILQRLGYDHLPSEKMQIKFIRSLTEGDTTLYRDYVKKYQDVEEFMGLIKQQTPFSAVRIFECFFHELDLSPKAPTYGVYEPACRPLRDLARQGVIHPEIINVRKALAAIGTEVLLVPARWDNILPYEEMMDMNKNMRHSRLVILNDLHTMTNNTICVSRLVKAFFENGAFSPDVDRVLAFNDCSLWK